MKEKWKIYMELERAGSGMKNVVYVGWGSNEREFAIRVSERKHVK